MINRENWLDTKAFLKHQETTMQNSPLTVRRMRVALRPLLEWADKTPLGNARAIEPTFPAYLARVKTASGKKYASMGGEKALKIAKQFLSFARSEWPARYKGISESWLQTLRPAKENAAQSRLKDHAHYTLDDILKIAALPAETLREKRDIAAVCFLFLSGMRLGAFLTLPIECVDIKNNEIQQAPEKGVMTKGHKAAVTNLLQVPEILKIVTEWDSIVREKLLPSDFWYPVISINDPDEFISGKKTQNRQPKMIGKLRQICARAGITYLSPHKLRHGHVVYAIKNVKDMVGLKAISQNVMHASVSITDGIYGGLSSADVKKIITSIGQARQENPPPAAENDPLQAALAILSALQANPEALKILTGKQ